MVGIDSRSGASAPRKRADARRNEETLQDGRRGLHRFRR